MKTYLVSFCFIRSSKAILLDGPESFDILQEYLEWRNSIIEKTGPEPNICCYGSHKQWLLKHLEVLTEYQQLYKCTGDFTNLFVEHLVQRCGFTRREYHAIKLV